MGLSEHINFLIQASASARAEQEGIANQRGVVPDFVNMADRDSVAATFATGEVRDPIWNYLRNLDDDTVRKLLAIMHFGCGSGDLQTQLQSLRDNGERKEQLVKAIAEKRTAYPAYFQKALSVLASQGVSVDSI